MIRQLRIYEIFPHNKDAFHARFRDHAVRIMARHGFQPSAGWETTFGDRLEFVYVVDWPDESTMRERWAAFGADEEWKAIKRESTERHGDLVGEIEDRVLRPVDYLPDAPVAPPS